MPPAKKTKSKLTKDTLTVVKGMHDILEDRYYDYQGFFEKAQEVAMYYGFTPIETPIVEHTAVFTSSIGEGTDIIDKEMYTFDTKGGTSVSLRPEATAAIMRSYIDNGMRSLPQPVMKYWYGSLFRHEKPQRGRYRQFKQFDLEILGTTKSVADALIIQTTLTILQEAGAKNLSVDINSIGDKDSRTEYLKELKSFYRRHLDKLPEVDRARLKTNPMRILDSKEPATIEINKEAPEAICHLSPTSKKHFKEVLEYLEEANIEYTINKNLVRGLSYYTNTVFEVVETVADTDTKLAICGGGRYDYLAGAMGHKKDIPGVGVAIGVERVLLAPWWNNLQPRNVKEPKIYFVQLGFEAKLKSITILEMLRKAKIPVAQSLSKDRLSAQLSIAEKMGVDKVLIFGHKEAKDGTIIVREMGKRSQETIPYTDLISYLRKNK